MRHLVLAALAMLVVGATGAETAKADWREAILGNRIYDKPAPSKAPKTATKSTTAKKTAYAPSPKSSYTPSYGGGESGKASYYWQPQKVASGGWFNPNAMTAAHKSLPFGTRVRVTNQSNGRSVDVVINDRGPFVAGRIIDLSSAAAGVIGMKSAGVVPVKVAVLGR